MACNVLCGHINLQKGDPGALSLMEYLRTSLRTNNIFAPKSYLMGVQEPPSYRGRIKSFSRDGVLYYDTLSDRPRAAIYASRDLNLWVAPEFTNGDMATCLWKTEDHTFSEVMITSVYFDINFAEVWPASLGRLVRYCKKRSLELFILADTNAHSTLWGCNTNNARGDTLEEYIFMHNLTICNHGKHYTFFNRRSETIIDVTLATPRIADKVEQWRVSEAVTGSDHLLITFYISISINNITYQRIYGKGDWYSFQAHLETISTIPEVEKWNKSILDKEASKFEEDITTALNQAFPEQKLDNCVRPFHWWSKELQRLRREVHQLSNQYRQLRLDSARDRLNEARRRYSRAIRRAKRKHWKRFTSEVSDVKKASLINKIINAGSNKTLGLLTKNGVICTPTETINLLLDVHFPGSWSAKIWPHEGNLPEVPLVESTFTAADTMMAINSFGDRKSPGCDKIHPIVLKHLGEKAIKRLTNLFNASLQLGYVPVNWRRARVIYIPKPGKDSYESPRSFRPITLSSFMVKTMERVIQTVVEQTVLPENPLNMNQHAFRKGRSTETALSNVVEFIELSLSKKLFTLGIFLDIQGAFDNVKPTSIVNAMKNKRFPNKIIRWYEHYLKNRSVELNHKGISQTRKLRLGTPQGGVLSPLMWNLVFDSLLEKFEEGRVMCCGYADDAALLIAGDKPHFLVDQMNRAIDKALEWGRGKRTNFQCTQNNVCSIQ